MKLIKHIRTTCQLMIVLVLLLGAGVPGYAQDDSPTLPEAAFVAYRCEFQPQTNSTRIRAALIGADGLPIPDDSYTVTVSVADSGAMLPPDKVMTVAVPERPPLRIILLLDITDTVPVEQIVDAVGTRLVPQLEVLDEVALITFGEEISERTQFYTDKNRLIRDHIIDLSIMEGNNRLYDAILDAVYELPFASNMRQVVLVLTDSGRREDAQTSSDIIIANAAESKIQVFSIGYRSHRDIPDADELTQIANGTQSHAWIYDGFDDSNTAIEAAVSDFLDDFIISLNSEILMTVDMPGQQPDANRQIVLDISVDVGGESPLTDQITCPMEILNHSISFISEPGDEPVTGLVDIGVAVESDMNLDDTLVAFWVNDEIVQNSPEHNYTFDSSDLQPGYYTIGAQLRDQYNQVLATTSAPFGLYILHMMQLNFAEDEGSNATRFEVFANAELGLTDVNFVIESVSNPEEAYTLGDGAVPFDDNGKATLVVDDLPETIRTLFPNMAEGDAVQIRASIPGDSPDEPEQATSNNVTFVPVSPASSIPAIDIADINLKEYVPAAIIIFLIVLNILLFRWIKQAKIKRIIRKPDDYELSQQLMAVTVRKGGTKQTHTLTKKTIYIGRGASNDINLGDDARISRRHGLVMWRKEAWWYSNRKRRTKTRINGKWKRGYIFYKLEPITELEIGNAQLVFHSHAQRDISDFISTNL